MSDLINRQDVIEMLGSEPHNEPRYPAWWIMKVSKIPAKNEAVQGNWIYRNSWIYKDLECNLDWQIMLTLECSECEMLTFVDKGISYDYCPHCGANMRGDISAV